MFRIAKSDELEWRKQLAEEIKAMMFKSPQPRCVQEVLEDIQSKCGDADCRERDIDLEDLNLAMNNLEVALSRMEKLGKRGVEDHDVPETDGPHGPSVPPTHESIFNHSRCRPHAQFVWISKTSTVDHEGNLGHPARADEIRKYGEEARKVFIHKPPFVIQKSFMEATMNRDPDWLAKRPWVRRGEEEHGGTYDCIGDDQDHRAKRQHGMGVVGGGVGQQGWEDRVGGGGHRFDDPRGANHQAQGQVHQGAESHRFKGKQKEEGVEK
jgi:hypothetical protein